jgi:hypothetical protein
MLQPDPNDRFRQRRQQARRRIARRRLTALAVLVLAFGAVTLGFRYLGESDTGKATSSPQTPTTLGKAPNVTPATLPAEIRGVHVTMALLSLPGKLDEYLALRNQGATAIELDVKDENGEVGFQSSYAPLARKIGSAKTYYNGRQVARKVHQAGLYLIGRVVMFEDPYLASKRPDMAIQRRGGGIFTSNGLGWSNEYDKRVWDYNVDIAEAAARAGFDEIMFDYVRFPSDGQVGEAVYPGRVNERKGETIARFLAYARERLKPLGVRISAAVFGLAATRDLGIGQRPKLMAPHLDAIYPMVYPSHFGSGEYNIADPDNAPGATVTMALRQFRRQLTGSQTKLVPWLQDFSLGRTYTLGDVQSQIDAARKLRSTGYLLWNANGVYTKAALGY